MSEKISEGRKVRAGKIDKIREIFQAVEGGVLTDFRGLDMKAMTDLRLRFREKGVQYKVVKNTLTRIALQGSPYQRLQDLLDGPVGIAFTSEDPITPARVAIEFAKDNDTFKVRGGFMEGDVLTEDEVKEISKIPGKQELKAQFLSVLNGSPQRFLGTINALPQKFLGVLQARADQLEDNQS